MLDLTDASSDIEKTVDISTYLPSGTALVISSDSKIDVTVVVEAVKTKTLQIPVTNLQVIGLDADEKVQYEEDNICPHCVRKEQCDRCTGRKDDFRQYRSD